MVLTLPGSREPFDVEFVVDTGYEGDLAVSSALALHLDADYVETRPIALADGSERDALIYILELEWNGVIRPTEVMVLDGKPLIGMFLLEGCDLHIDAIEGGEAIIQEL